MRFEKQPMVRVVKRLSEAIGYLELGMPDQASVALDHATNPGPLAPMVDMLRGEVARQQGRLEDAADSLEAAAPALPAPLDRSVWAALSAYYRQAGNADRAVNSLARARGAWSHHKPAH